MAHPPRRLTRRESQQKTRERLLDAAATVIQRHGYAGASLESVAETAGYTKGAVYSNFATKADLFLALLDRHVDEEAAAQARQLEVQTLSQFVQSLDETFVRQVGASPRWIVLQMEFWLAAVRDPDLRERLVAHAEKRHRLATSMIEHALAAEGVRSPFRPDELATLTTALGVGLAVQHQLEPASIDPSLVVRAAQVLFGIAPAAGRG